MVIGEVYFDKYKVLSLLGEGGMSRVYLVENTKLGNNWAIKQVCKDTKGIEILAEADILKRLNHSAIPKIIDIEYDETHIYIVEEFIEGINLKSLKVNQAYLSEQQIIDWGLQLAEVVSYLHGQQPSPIIFRDIKPNNIMITHSNHIKLVDFGIAREYKQNKTTDTAPLGSRGYAAPEQFGGDQSDERTDIFALGVTLHFLLTGKDLGVPPYRLRLDDEDCQDYSEMIRQIIGRCCETLPEDRYQTVADVMNDLKSLQSSNINHLSKYEKKRTRHKKRADVMQLKKLHKTFNIGVAGVAYGVGSTHTAIMLATALGKHHAVAIVDMSGYNTFQEILFSLDDVHDNKDNRFNFKKVAYFWDQDFTDFQMKERKAYDFIVWDFGDTISKQKGIQDF